MKTVHQYMNIDRASFELFNTCASKKKKKKPMRC